MRLTEAKWSWTVNRWRVGEKVPLNVYEGDRPVCQCHTQEDARMIVYGMNAINSVSEFTCNIYNLDPEEEPKETA